MLATTWGSFSNEYVSLMRFGTYLGITKVSSFGSNFLGGLGASTFGYRQPYSLNVMKKMSFCSMLELQFLRKSPSLLRKSLKVE